jgi:hypothetical protein
MTSIRNHRHRVDLPAIRQATAWADLDRVSVPADHLVCSGNHVIDMALTEAEDAYCAA